MFRMSAFCGKNAFGGGRPAHDGTLMTEETSANIASVNCRNGHRVAQGQPFCGECGTAMVAHAPGTSQRHDRAGGRRAAWVAGAVAVAVALAVVVGYLVLGPEKGRELTVTIGDPMAGGDCSPGDYTASYIVGTRITVKDAAGEILGSNSASGEGQSTPADNEYGLDSEGCYWEIRFADIPRSTAYTIDIELPAGKFDGGVAPAPQSLTYSEQEMEDENWNIILSNNF
jgi:hypothetical protein